MLVSLIYIFTNIHLLWNGEPSLIAKRACTHKPLPLLIDCCVVLYYYVESFDKFCEWLVNKIFEISTGIICRDLNFLIVFVGCEFILNNEGIYSLSFLLITGFAAVLLCLRYLNWFYYN